MRCRAQEVYAPFPCHVRVSTIQPPFDDWSTVRPIVFCLAYENPSLSKIDSSFSR